MPQMSRVGNCNSKLTFSERARYAAGLLLKLICLLFLLCISSPVLSQEIDPNLTQILKTYDEAELASRINSIAKRYEGMAVALYLDAVIEKDANIAVEKYLQLLTKFPDSKYSEAALFKVGQYHFSRGLYVSARKYFLQLIEDFPESNYSDEAMYNAAACLHAVRNYESCRSELHNFLQNNPDSPLRKIAERDLDEIESQTSHSGIDRNQQLQKSSGKFTLQVGAFNQINNALNLRNYLSKLGLPVELREKNERNETWYLVWLGSFESEKEAREFGETFKEEHGKPYRIVTRY